MMDYSFITIFFINVVFKKYYEEWIKQVISETRRFLYNEHLLTNHVYYERILKILNHNILDPNNTVSMQEYFPHRFSLFLKRPTKVEITLNFCHDFDVGEYADKDFTIFNLLQILIDEKDVNGNQKFIFQVSHSNNNQITYEIPDEIVTSR